MTLKISPVWRVALALAPTLFAVHAMAAEEASLPERKAGLWELKTTMDEGKGPVSQTLKVCIGAEMETNTVRASIADHKKNCESYDIKKSDAQTVVEAKCTYNGRVVDSTTTMTGDFKTAFEVKIASRTSDTRESTGQSVVVVRSIDQLGSYSGESCGELQAGEAAGADGAKVSVQ